MFVGSQWLKCLKPIDRSVPCDRLLVVFVLSSRTSWTFDWPSIVRTFALSQLSTYVKGVRSYPRSIGMSLEDIGVEWRSIARARQSNESFDDSRRERLDRETHSRVVPIRNEAAAASLFFDMSLLGLSLSRAAIYLHDSAREQRDLVDGPPYGRVNGFMVAKLPSPVPNVSL